MKWVGDTDCKTVVYSKFRPKNFSHLLHNVDFMTASSIFSQSWCTVSWALYQSRQQNLILVFKSQELQIKTIPVTENDTIDLYNHDPCKTVVLPNLKKMNNERIKFYSRIWQLENDARRYHKVVPKIRLVAPVMNELRKDASKCKLLCLQLDVVPRVHFVADLSSLLERWVLKNIISAHYILLWS